MFSETRFLPVLLATALLGAVPAARAAGPAVAGGTVFSGERAFSWLERQVELGPRVPGSRANLALRELIIGTASELGFAATPVCLTVADPLGGEDVEICNVVVSIPPRGTPAADRLWVAAHFDTRPIADQDRDPARRGLPVPGANDGASGTAVLLHLMEILAAEAPPTAVDLLFFDGEDSGAAGDAAGFCLGSRHLAATWQDFGSPLAGPPPRGLVLLDMIGDAELSVPMEATSLQYAGEWTTGIFARAAELGLTAFEPVPGRAVFDDHVPFLAAGIPAVDLIDFDYPHWHTTADTPEACSPGSLAQVGTLVLDLIRRP